MSSFFGGEHGCHDNTAVSILFDRYSSRESVYFVDNAGGIVQIEGMNASDLLNKQYVSSLLFEEATKIRKDNQLHDLPHCSSYEKFFIHTEKRLFKESQIQSGAQIFCGRSPSTRNCAGLEDCGLYSYGGRGYGFFHCNGFCGNYKCPRTIQRKALQILRRFTAHCSRRYFKKNILEYGKIAKSRVRPKTALELLFIVNFADGTSRFLGHICDFL
jgi:hypothetical protein